MSTLAWIALTALGIGLYLLILLFVFALCQAAKRGDAHHEALDRIEARYRDADSR